MPCIYQDSSSSSETSGGIDATDIYSPAGPVYSPRYRAITPCSISQFSTAHTSFIASPHHNPRSSSNGINTINLQPRPRTHLLHRRANRPDMSTLRRQCPKVTPDLPLSPKRKIVQNTNLLPQRRNLHQLPRPRLQHLRLRTLQPCCRCSSSPSKYQLHCLASNSEYNTRIVCIFVSWFVEPDIICFLPFTSADEGCSDLATI